MKFCVIGLGQFGEHLAVELQKEGHEVLALDHQGDRVEAIKDAVSLAARMDASDVKALQGMGLKDMDAVIVSIGEDFAASLMITAHLQKMGVPQIYCRVINEVHDHLLNLMEVKEKIRPEAMAARQLAKRLGISRATRHFGLENGFAIVELPVPKFFLGKKLSELDMRGKYGFNLITVKRLDSGKDGAAEVLGVPSPEFTFSEHDLMILFGRESAIQSFSRKAD
jgi:trk system potassium uptake protein TrkA